MRSSWCELLCLYLHISGCTSRQQAGSASNVASLEVELPETQVVTSGGESCLPCSRGTDLPSIFLFLSHPSVRLCPCVVLQSVLRRLAFVLCCCVCDKCTADRVGPVIYFTQILCHRAFCRTPGSLQNPLINLTEPAKFFGTTEFGWSKQNELFVVRKIPGIECTHGHFSPAQASRKLSRA